MAEEPEGAVGDLEDGEIESDGEDTSARPAEPAPEIKSDTTAPIKSEESRPKESKKKKSKNHNKEDKSNKGKDKPKKKHPGPVEDDFAGNIEKAIRKAMKNDDDVVEVQNIEEENGEDEARRKGKKRKKHDSTNSSKKRRRRKHTDEFNDDEMMFTRGASPVKKSPSPCDYRSDESCASEGSYEDHRNHHSRQPQRNRPPPHFKDRKNNKNNRDRRRDNIHPLQDPDGVCVYFMQGKCHKGEDCAFSHNAQPPRKMELCKFYLMDCCAKRDKCLYMHSDFPCKYWHTGLPCIYKDECKFAHGGPLGDTLKSILLKHLESAPKEILGDFPRLNRESAAMMVLNRQMVLAQQFSSEPNDMMNDPNIPSIFELNMPKPINQDDMQNPSQYNQYSHDKHSNNKNAHKARQSRWQTTNTNTLPNLVVNAVGTQDVLNIKNLTGVLTPQQISELSHLGIENLNQLSSLTVIQLNQLGLNLKQINEIQLNTMSIQKLGLINGGEEHQPSVPNYANAVSGNMDFDMRIPPMAPEVTNKSAVPPSAGMGKDVDMRFQSTASLPPKNSSTSNEGKESKYVDSRVNKDTIDIDQYTKDALKFASKEKENIDNMSTDFHDDGDLTLDVPKSKDIDQRVLPFKDVPVTTSLSEGDTDIRFLQPDNYPKKAEKRHRRSTTDDEDNNLLIDEKWYSSDEEKSTRTKSPKSSPRPSTPPVPLAVIETRAVLNKLGDLSKIDISDEVTKLLTTMKNKLQESKDKMPSPSSEHSKPRDPRSDPRNFPKKSPDHKSPSTDLMKVISHRKPKISIYECIEGQPTDGRKRSDVDLRQLDQDFRLPGFGDTDLRPTSSGDIDFRYGLPFKPLPNYTPATEIDGSINCHPPIPYKMKQVDIPRPDYTDIKNSTAKSQAMADPRLRKLFRLSIDESSSDGEKSTKIASTPRTDPRRKPSVADIMETKPTSLDLQNVTNTSTWYKELSTNQKIFANQSLATINSIIKKYQQEKHLGKRFDTSQIHNNMVFCTIFKNLGVTIDEAGDVSYVNKPQEGLLKTPLGFSGNPEPYSGNMMDGHGMMNSPQMALGNMGPIGNMNMNPMGGYNAPYPTPEPRPTPGLLGIAPNMPHGYDNPNFGPPNFGPDGFHGNMQFNSSGNDFGNMDSDQGYHRNQGRGNYRGRGNESRTWSRAGNRGNRDRRNFNDRGGGGWKGDRH